MSRFEDTLWADLASEHGARLAELPEPHRRRGPSWPVLVVAGAVLAATGVVIAPGLGGTAPPAYAVEQHPDGTVTLTINEMAAADQATAELRKLGVRATVLGQPAGDGLDAIACSPAPRPPAPAPPGSVPTVARLPVDFPSPEHPNVMTIHPDQIPPDSNLVMQFLKFEQRGENPAQWSVGVGVVRGEPTGCWKQQTFGSLGAPPQ